MTQYNTSNLVNEVEYRKENAARAVVEINDQINRTYPSLKDEAIKITNVVLPLTTFCRYDSPNLLSTLDSYVRKAKEFKMDSDDATNLGLLNIIDLSKGDVDDSQLLEAAIGIYSGAESGKIDREKLIGFWSTWNSEAATVLGLLNAKYVVDGKASVRDIVSEAHDFYKSLEEIDWSDTTAGIFAAKDLAGIMSGNLDAKELRRVARELYDCARVYPELKWGSDEAKELVICYARDVVNGTYSPEQIVPVASDLYLQAKKKDVSMGKDKWSEESSIKLALNNAGQVIKNGNDVGDLISAVNVAYKYFTQALPKKGLWIFKSNEEQAENAARTYVSTMNTYLGQSDEKLECGLEGKVERDVVTATIDQMIEDEIMSQIIMNSVIINTAIMSSVIASSTITASTSS